MHPTCTMDMTGAAGLFPHLLRNWNQIIWLSRVKMQSHRIECWNWAVAQGPGKIIKKGSHRGKYGKREATELRSTKKSVGTIDKLTNLQFCTQHPSEGNIIASICFSLSLPAECQFRMSAAQRRELVLWPGIANSVRVMCTGFNYFTILLVVVPSIIKFFVWP